MGNPAEETFCHPDAQINAKSRTAVKFGQEAGDWKVARSADENVRPVPRRRALPRFPAKLVASALREEPG